MIKKIIFVLTHSAWYRRLNAKVIYEILAKQVPAANWHFMNYGYSANEYEKPLALPDDPHLQRYSLQMYHYLAVKAPIEGKMLLEVGSGRGGGARHIAGHLKPASYTGMDLAQNAVELASKIHQLPNLRFIQGNAESIPVADNSMDVVLNVESCHSYGCVKTFLKEVRRVLKPGGHLLLVDFRKVENIEEFRQQLRSAGLEWVEEEDITDNVVRAIEAEDDAKKGRIRELIPNRWRKLFEEFAGVVGSKMHLDFKHGGRLYCRYVLRKAVA